MRRSLCMSMLWMSLSVMAPGCFWVSPEELDERLDADGDGVPRPDDCNDDDPSVQTETEQFVDGDGDGAGDPDQPALVCGPTEGFSTSAGDCDDIDADVGPGADEVCDGVDNDCDDMVDDGVLDTFFVDGDGDGVGSEEIQACTAPAGAVVDGGDCNDAEPAILPGATETCDTIDNDCDGLVDDQDPGLDPVLHSWYFDGDIDGYGDATTPLIRCFQPPQYVSNDLDCNDADPEVRPGALELCDGVDDDCDGVIDDDAADAATFYTDGDGDGWGDGSQTVRSCTQPAGVSIQPGDCDDTSADVSPGADEVCNGVDDDCDALVDGADPGVTGAPMWFEDLDGDGFGANATVVDCTQPAGFVADGGDCNDSEPTVAPDVDEVCDGIDNDCDGDVDDDDGSLEVSSTTLYYQDSDGDGFGDDGVSTDACLAPAGFTGLNGDCDDSDPLTSPGSPEQCDGVDNDCNSQIDDDVVFSSWYPDDDGDGAGRTVDELVACLAPDGHVLVAGDCNDGDATISPLAVEVCSGQDDDCDGLADGADPDVDAPVWHRDQDGDGFGDPGLTLAACQQPVGFVEDATDCADGDATRNPAADEVCNTVDDDCDGAVDDSDPSLGSPPTWYLDRDGDQFGVDDVTATSCVAPVDYVDEGGDCDDLSSQAADVFPGADIGSADVQDGLDRDCDGVEECFVDADDDGFGADVGPDDGNGLCVDAGEASQSGDCNDLEPAAFPGGPVVVADGIDNDCSGLEECHLDVDGDMFGIVTVVDDNGDGVCSGGGEAPNADDCADDDATVFPGSPEQCDGVDDDCDGMVDEDVVESTWYQDGDGDGIGGDTTTSDCLQPSGFVAQTGDCDDADDTVFPGAGTVPADVQDGADRNCDGVDECFSDADGDGVGIASIVGDDGDGVCDDAGESASPNDCNDSDASTNPGATLVAADVDDGVDRDCDGRDECFADADGDGSGSTTVVADSGDGVCNDSGESLASDDCDDQDASVFVGASVTLTDIADGTDRDCNGREECALDADGDGVGVAMVIDDDGDGACDDPGESARTDDCDDTDHAVSPTAVVVVVADGIDQDCDGAEECHVDGDGDGFGESGVVADDGDGTCNDAGESNNDDDCNDTEADAYPGAPVVAVDGIDQDCDGVDECFLDADGDGFAGSTTTPDGGAVGCADAGEGTAATDCRDSGPNAAMVFPGAPISDIDVADGLDGDCDGLEECFADGDGDGWGGGYVDDDGNGACVDAGEAAVGGDCADADADISPDADEICANGVDEDCDEAIDAADPDAMPVPFYSDLDGDTYGDPGSEVFACVAPPLTVQDDQDCDDSDGTVNPIAVEVCDDGVDNDCDGGPGVCLLTGDVPVASLAVWLAGTGMQSAGSAVLGVDVLGDAAPELLFGAPGGGGSEVAVASDMLIAGGDLDVDIAALLTGGNDGAGTALGFLDDTLLVGAPDWSSAGPPKGAVFLLPVPVEDGALDVVNRLEGANLTETGHALAVMDDFYGDGATVLAVGAPGGTGQVYLLRDPVGLDGSIAGLADDAISGSENQDQVGVSLATVPDTNGDGRDELLVGSPGLGQDGAAWLVRSVPGSGLVEDADVRFISLSAAVGRYGATVAAPGDVDGDGSVDLAIVNAPLGAASTVHLVTSIPVTAGATVDLDTTQRLTDGSGALVVEALGDLDGDGFDDVAVGDPEYDDGLNVDVGRVAIFFGPILTDRSLDSADLMLTGSLAAQEIGGSLDAVDLDGDGRAELVVGAPGDPDVAAWILAGTLGL